MEGSWISDFIVPFADVCRRLPSEIRGGSVFLAFDPVDKWRTFSLESPPPGRQ